MTDVTVLTAIYGGHDDLHEPVPQDMPVHWLCVTDDKTIESPTWTAVHEPRDELDPRMAAKIPKFRPDLWTHSDVTIWIDAAFEVVSPTFVSDMVRMVEKSRWALFRHPWRDCIYDEADASVGLAKYAGQPIAEQVASYRPATSAHAGLWASGLIVRQFCEASIRLGDLWLDECERWTVQDQLSLPVVLRQLCIWPHPIPGDIFANEWVCWHRHLAGDW